MQKSYLSAFYNDPKLNKFPQDKKIQPLFKKSFVLQEEALKKHLEDSELLKHTNLSETMHIRPPSSDAKIKVRNVSNPKIESNNEMSRDALEFLINKLRSEKLEVYKELLTYEEKYQHKLCLRARLEEIKSLCHDLLDMSRIASERLNIENDLYGYLQMGTLGLTQEKFCLETSSDEEEDNQDELYESLVQISGVACVCLAKKTDLTGLNFSIYPYLFAQPIGVSLEMQVTKDTIEDVLETSVLPYLSFVYNDELKLQFNESEEGSVKFFTKIKNIKNPIEVLIRVDENGIELEANSLKIVIQDPYLFEVLQNGKLLEANTFISNNLAILEIDQEKSLVWQARNWEIKKHSVRQIEHSNSLKDFEDSQCRFEEFFMPCIDCYLPVYEIQLQVWKNAVSGKIKFIITKRGKTIVIREENYPDEFAFLETLQDIDLASSQATLISSLEFGYFINKFVS